MPESLPPYLDSLNPEQRRAVLHTGRPLLILAGAGSGKTRVITTKIAYLIREKNVDPFSIMAVTFTNKAAREMAERARLIDERAGQAMLRTFHSFGAWFLRRNGMHGGLESGFIIYDDADSEALLSTIMDGAPRAEVKTMAHYIARAKDFFLSPEDPDLDLINDRKSFKAIYAKYEEKLSKMGNVDFGDLIKKPVEILRNESEIARRFRERFSVIMVDEYQDANVAQSELLKELCGSGAYICVVGDDDQSIYRFRGAEVKNILKFPEYFDGADIIRLEQNYRSTAPILKVAASVVDHNKGRLGKQLRTERVEGKTPVLAFLPDQDTEAEFCAELIQKSIGAAPDGAKKKGASSDPSGSRLSGYGALGAGVTYSSWAIVYRTNAQSLGFETEFLRRHIPYKVVGSLKFYEREEVKDILALLSFLVNPRDEVAFRRVVNKPSRGVGPATVDRITEAAQGGDLSLAAKRLAPELSAKARSGIGTFLKAIEAGKAALASFSSAGIKTADSKSAGSNTADFNDAGSNAADSNAASSGYEDSGPSRGNPLALAGGKTKAAAARGEGARKSEKLPKTDEKLFAGVGLSACVVSLAKESGIAEYHRTYDELTGNQRLSNLQEVVNAASLYDAAEEGLLEFLEHIELDRSLDESSGDVMDAVTLITLHNTKGLEFRRVIMTGIEQGIFPRDDKSGDDLEEERRLFYVGATRAMDELYMTSCAFRRMYGRTLPMEPSLFLREVDKETLRVIGSAPNGFILRGNGDGSGSAYSSSAYSNSMSHGNTSRKNLSSSDGRWALGDRVYNDDHGYGSITQILEGDEGPVIKVIYETGHEARFLSQHQSSRYTKIKED